MDRPFEKLGSRIREARVACGYSQKDVAEDLGVSVQSVSQWETGRSQPTADNLLKISKLLEVTHDWLRSGEGHRDKLFLRSTGGRDELRSRYAPVIVPGSNFSFNLQTPDFLERISDDTIIAKYAGVGKLFAIEFDADGPETEYRKGAILIFDTGLMPRAGDTVLAAFSTLSVSFGRVKSVELLDDGALLAKLRTWIRWSSQTDDGSSEVDVYISTHTMAVMVEHRRFRQK